MGATEDEAFSIACDRSTMTQDDILNGRLICEIGIAPVRPAEFVIFRIFQNTAEAQCSRPRRQRRHDMARNDPLRNFRFRLEIDEITQALFQRGRDRRDDAPSRSTIAKAPIRPTSASFRASPSMATSR